MADVFISYSRQDREFVRRLHESLAACDRDTWVDWEDIPPTAEWLAEIFAAIEGANAFLFILSPDSAISEVCQKELAHAVVHNKRLIPVVCREVNSKDVLESLSKLNWIFLRESDDFDAGVEKLLEAVGTDLDWVKAHTRLLTRAIEWDGKGHDKSCLLRGSDLKEAESWLARSGDKEPKPTEIQGQYILASRKGTTSRLRLILSAVTAGLVIAVALAIIAFIQYRRADERGRIALSRQLSAQSTNLLDSRLDLALLLSLESLRTRPTLEARSSLLSGLLARPQLITHFHGHSDTPTATAFSPDGKILASGGQDGKILLWDTATHQTLDPPLTGHRGLVECLAFSPDGRLLVSGSADDKALFLWNVVERQRLKPISRLPGSVTSVALEPDGRSLVIGTSAWENNLVLFYIASGEPAVKTISGHISWVSSLAFSPDGLFWASGSKDGSVILWEKNGRLSKVLLEGEGDMVHSLVFSPDGKLLASGHRTGAVLLWDVRRRRRLGRPLAGRQGAVQQLAFSPDSRVLLSVSNKEILRWDVARRRQLSGSLLVHGGVGRSVSFSPDRRFMAATGPGNIVLLSDASLLWRQPPSEEAYLEPRQSMAPPAPSRLGRVLTRSFLGASHLAFSPDGKSLAAGGTKHLLLWNVTNQQKLSQPLIKRGGVGDLAFSPDGRSLVTLGGGGVRLWDITGGKLRVQSTAEKDEEFPIKGLAFSPEGEVLAAGESEGDLYVWELTSEITPTPLKGSRSFLWEVVFSPNSRILASRHEDGKVILWDLKRRQPLGPPLESETGAARDLAFSRDGRLLAFIDPNGSIVLWEVNQGRPQGVPIKGHSGLVDCLAFSPDSSILATGGGAGDHTIILWDVAARKPIGPPLQGHGGNVKALAFSPDGSLLASASMDNSVILWDVSLSSWKNRACRMANCNLTREDWRQFMGGRPYRKTCPSLPGPGE
jgi:WD40 repeat protein